MRASACFAANDHCERFAVAQPFCQDPATVDYLDLVQWPAMAITVIAAWYTSSKTKTRRGIGFWCFLASNVLWVIWGWHSAAYALIVLQLCLAAMNIRGARKNDAI